MALPLQRACSLAFHSVLMWMCVWMLCIYKRLFSALCLSFSWKNFPWKPHNELFRFIFIVGFWHLISIPYHSRLNFNAQLKWQFIRRFLHSCIHNNNCNNNTQKYRWFNTFNDISIYRNINWTQNRLLLHHRTLNIRHTTFNSNCLICPHKKYRVYWMTHFFIVVNASAMSLYAI